MSLMKRSSTHAFSNDSTSSSDDGSNVKNADRKIAKKILGTLFSEETYKEYLQDFKQNIYRPCPTDTTQPTRKLLVDAVIGVTYQDLQRLSFRAGVLFFSDNVIEELRGEIKKFVAKIIERALVFALDGCRMTVKREDIRRALIFTGNTVYGCSERQYNDVRQGKDHHPITSNIMTAWNARLDCIYSEQLGTDKVLKSEVVKIICRKVASGDYKCGLQFTEKAVDILQVALEAHLIKLLTDANKIACYTGRLILISEDIAFVRSLRGSDEHVGIHRQFSEKDDGSSDELSSDEEDDQTDDSNEECGRDSEHDFEPEEDDDDDDDNSDVSSDDNKSA